MHKISPNVVTRLEVERHNQNMRWGGPEHDDAHTPGEGITILTSQFGKLARGVLNRDRILIRRQLFRIAAVCLAWNESIARNTPPPIHAHTKDT